MLLKQQKVTIKIHVQLHNKHVHVNHKKKSRQTMKINWVYDTIEDVNRDITLSKQTKHNLHISAPAFTLAFSTNVLKGLSNFDCFRADVTLMYCLSFPVVRKTTIPLYIDHLCRLDIVLRCAGYVVFLRVCQSVMEDEQIRSIFGLPCCIRYLVPSQLLLDTTWHVHIFHFYIFGIAVRRV